MAEKKPLVLYEGKVKEILPGDTLPSSGTSWGNIQGDLPNQVDLWNQLQILQAQINVVTAVGNKLFNYYNFI